MKSAKAFGLLAAFAFSISAHAIPTWQPPLQNHEIRLGIESNHYLAEISAANSNFKRENLGARVEIRSFSENDRWQYGLDAGAQLGSHNSYHYYTVNELYGGVESVHSKSRWNAYAGVKKLEWNALDSYWTLGLFQRRFRWDYLREQEGGLLGAFVGYQTELFQAEAYASPFFIPEQGAPFDISGGKCRSSSPWFSCPAAEILVFNQPAVVRYSLKTPPLSELVSHAGAGGTVRIGGEQGLFTRLSYAHKPLNQIILAFEGSLDLSANDVPAIIRPRILYHNLYGADLGWRQKTFSFVASGMSEIPVRDGTPPGWNTQELSNATILGATMVVQPDAGHFHHSRFEISYINRNGGDAPDLGPFSNPYSSYFEPRHALQNAYSIALVSPLFDGLADSFLFSTKFVVDTLHEGNILITDAYIRPSRQWLLNLGLDMLGSKSSAPVDFISRYQRNDRVRFGAVYAF